MSKYTMGPCESCGSSDAFASYDDGVGTCFSCGTSKKLGDADVSNNSSTDRVRNDAGFHDNQQPTSSVSKGFDSVESIHSYSSYPMGSRGISKEVVDHFNVKMETSQDGKQASHFYPLTKNGVITAYKQRVLPKDFRHVGDSKGVELFGQSQATGTKMLVITEGEIDALSVAQSWRDTGKPIYAVVSLPSASGVAAALLNRSFINRFDSVVLMLDNDEPGREATEKLAKIIKAGKCKIANLPEKDPNETLLKHGANALIRAMWDAQPWNPAGIIQGEAVWDQFMQRQNIESIPYPECLEGLNRKLKGIRHGEITLFTSGTGSGKSTVIKEIILDLLAKTDDKIGLISLEESVGDTAEKFISMSLKRSLVEPPPLTEQELRVGFNNVFGDERLVLLDHQGSVGDSSLIDKIEYMALMGCRYLVLDHITIAVSEGSDGLSGNEAVDKMMSDLLKVCKKHNVWLGLISHLRKAPGGGSSFEEGKLASIDDIKGSGSIKQISFDIISFARNLVAESETERNIIKFRVLKSRFTGLTGDAGSATYNHKTCRLSATGGFNYE